LIEGLVEQIWLIILIIGLITIGSKFTTKVQLNAENEALAKECKRLQNQLNAKEGIPDLPIGDGKDVEGLVHGLLPFLPKFLRDSIGGNPEVISSLISWAQKNPKMIKPLVDKLTGGKIANALPLEGSEQTTNMTSL